MKAPNASAARVDGIAATSQRDQKRARPRRQGGGKPRPGQMRMGAPAPAARGPKVALCGGPGGGRDLNHALVQLDESAIAGNVGRDLAFAASRLAARSHPGVGGCAAPSSLVIFGISQPNARWTAGCSSPSGQRCSLYARTRHERAHICRGDDGRGTSRSRATACSRRAEPRGKRTASWLAHARLGLDCHEFPSVFSRACARDRLVGAAAACALCAPHSLSATARSSHTRRVWGPCANQRKGPSTLYLQTSFSFCTRERTFREIPSTMNLRVSTEENISHMLDLRMCFKRASGFDFSSTKT